MDKRDQIEKTREGIEWETVTLYQEACDCGSQIQHNNGGNYHRIEVLHIFSHPDKRCWCVVFERTSTREYFLGDEFEMLILDEHGFQLLREDQYYRYFIGDDYLARFRQGEAEIVYCSL